MTAQADFTPEEWKTVLEGPPSAGLIVITAQRGGTFRETFSIGKTYAEARQHHGQSELLDEIVAAKPEIDRTRYGSAEELRDHALQHIRDAIALLEGKAEQQEQPDGAHGPPGASPQARRDADCRTMCGAAIPEPTRRVPRRPEAADPGPRRSRSRR